MAKEGKFSKKKKADMTVAENIAQDPVENTASNNKRVITIIVAVCMLVCLCASVYFLSNLGLSINLPGKTIPAGVSIAGVDVGGLKKSEAVEAVRSAVGDSYSTTPLVVTILDARLELTPAVSGAVFDIDGAVREAYNYGTEANPELQVDITPFLALNTDAIRNQVNEIAKQFPTEGVTNGHKILQETVDGKQQDVLEVTIGSKHYDFNADALYDTIISAYNNNKFTAAYNCKEITAAAVDLDALYAQYCKEAVEAILDPKTHEVTQSAVGYQFDLEAAKKALSKAKPGDVLKFPILDVQPEMDTETLKGMLFRDVLATYEAYQSSGEYRATNLRLACEAINGTILNPGDEFSYNQTLGERTPEKGYKPAGSYVNGETVDTYGGGICQPSSALYYCTLIADLEVLERYCHCYPSDYVPLGMDATVDWSGLDFRFKNNTPYPIRIDAVADGGSVTITLVGTDTKDYYVEMEYEIEGYVYPDTIVKEVEAGSGHEDGEVKTWPLTGYYVQSYKLKYDKETDELISREKEAYSDYAARDKVVYKVKQAPTEPTPKPTEPKPTETKPPETTVPTAPPETEPPETEPPETEPPETEPPETEPPETEPEPPADVTPPLSEDTGTE